MWRTRRRTARGPLGSPRRVPLPPHAASYVPAERPEVPARALPAPPDPRGRHKAPPLGPWSHPSAPQAVAGSLADRQKRAKTGDVRAERRGWVGMGPEAEWGALGVHVGPGNGAGGEAQVGQLVRVSLQVEP